jgi:hypothetical protein
MNHINRAIIVLLFLKANITFSQNVVLEVNNVRTLYFGYNNRLEFGTTDGRPFELIAEHAILELDSTRGEKQTISYFLKPTQNQNVRVFMVDPSSRKAFDTITFNVERIPDPEIFWGTSRNGEKGFVTANRLFVRYPPENSLLLMASWKIVSWECSISGISGKPISGVGQDVSSALAKIREAKSNQLNGTWTETKISFICTIVGPDGIQRKLSSVFKI